MPRGHPGDPGHRGHGSVRPRSGGRCCSGGSVRRSAAIGRRWERCSPGWPASGRHRQPVVRSITRLRFGAPPAPNCRERCSRLTSSRRASVVVRVGRSTSPRSRSQARCWIGFGQPQHAGRIGQGPAAVRRDRATRDDIAHDRIVHPLHRDGDHRMLTAGQQQLAVIGTEGSVGHDGDAGEERPERGELGQPRRGWA